MYVKQILYLSVVIQTMCVGMGMGHMAYYTTEVMSTLKNLTSGQHPQFTYMYTGIQMEVY